MTNLKMFVESHVTSDEEFVNIARIYNSIATVLLIYYAVFKIERRMDLVKSLIISHGNSCLLEKKVLFFFSNITQF